MFAHIFFLFFSSKRIIISIGSGQLCSDLHLILVKKKKKSTIDTSAERHNESLIQEFLLLNIQLDSPEASNGPQKRDATHVFLSLYIRMGRSSSFIQSDKVSLLSRSLFYIRYLNFFLYIFFFLLPLMNKLTEASSAKTSCKNSRRNFLHVLEQLI